MFTKYEKILFILITSVIILGLLSFIAPVLAAGAVLCVFLTALALLFFQNINSEHKKAVYFLFFIAFLTHSLFVLFIFYTSFYPFNGGWDQIAYDIKAQAINQRLHQGNFSVGGEGLPPLADASNYYPVLVGYLYALTFPSPLMGQLLNTWLTALIVVLSYFMVIEIGGGKKGAFLVGLAAIAYPSLAFNGSLLLKEPIVVIFSLLGLLLTIKLIKKFNWKLFFILFLVFAVITHFRFFLGYIAMFVFIACWFLFGNLEFKKRIAYSLAFVVILGFIPQFTTTTGYWGVDAFKEYLNLNTITYYRENIFAPKVVYVSKSQLVNQPRNYLQNLKNLLQNRPQPQPQKNQQQPQPQKTEKNSEIQVPVVVGPGSTFTVNVGFNSLFTFLINNFISFIYVLLGPFPWQIRYARHLFTLFETIPWYILFFFIVKGTIKSFRQRYKFILPLLLFSFIFIAVLALFINNFGYLTRVRVPAFIALLCLAPFGIKEDNFIFNYFRKVFSRVINRLKIRPVA